MGATIRDTRLWGTIVLLLFTSGMRADDHEDLRDIAKGLESNDEEAVRSAYLDLRGVTPAKMGAERGRILKALLARSKKGDRYAMGWLAQFGPEAKEAIPDMLKVLRHPGKGGAPYQLDAAKCLAKIGKPAVPGLIDVLQTKYMKEWGRIAAADALATMGPDAAPAVPVLLRLRMHWDGQVRSAAGTAIVKLGEHAIPALIEALNSDDDFLRGEAIVFLNEIGLPAKKAIPHLLPLRTDENRFIRESAVFVVARLSSMKDEP